MKNEVEVFLKSGVGGKIRLMNRHTRNDFNNWIDSRPDLKKLLK